MITYRHHRFQTSGGFWKHHVYFSKTTKPYGKIFGGAWKFKNNQTQQIFKRSKNFKIIINNGNNQFSNIPNNVPDKKNKILFAISYFDGTTFNWVQPRLENFLENENKKQKQKTQQIFYKFDNFCIYIKKVFGNQDENKAIKKQFSILKQTQLTMVYGSKFKIDIYNKMGRCRVCIKILRKKKVKHAMVAMDKPESLKDMINIAVKIDDRQYDRFVNKKTCVKDLVKKLRKVRNMGLSSLRRLFTNIYVLCRCTRRTTKN